MPINALIAQGVAPVGRDLPDIRFGIQRNALAQQEVDQRQQGYDMQQQQFDANRQDRATAQQQTTDQNGMKVALAKAQWAARPGMTKQQIQNQIPDIAQGYEQAHGPGTWAQADDASVQQLAQQAVVHLSSALGQGPPQQEYGAPVAGVGADGKPMYQRFAKDSPNGVPVTGFAPPPPKADTADAVDPQSIENTAQMIANNQIPMLSGFALKSKWGQEVVSRVREINPQFAGADYGANLAGIKQFTSGKNGNTVRSLNVAVQHLDQLGELSQALNNSDVPALNRISVAWKRNTGSAAPTNFDTAKKVVADEVVKAIVGSGGGVADREEAAKTINNAGSPAQLMQAIDTYKGLMAGQLNGLRQQYKASTGRDNFEDMLLPETKAQLEKHSAPPAPSAPAAPAAAPVTATGPNGQKLVLQNGQWVPQNGR